MNLQLFFIIVCIIIICIDHPLRANQDVEPLPKSFHYLSHVWQPLLPQIPWILNKGSEKESNFPKSTQLKCGRAKIKTQIDVIPKSQF